MRGLWCSLVAALAVPAMAFPVSGLRAQEPEPVHVESFTLSNGLKVHLVEDQ
jgi:hypothetical protein